MFETQNKNNIEEKSQSNQAEKKNRQVCTFCAKEFKHLQGCIPKKSQMSNLGSFYCKFVSITWRVELKSILKKKKLLLAPLVPHCKCNLKKSHYYVCFVNLFSNLEVQNADIWNFCLTLKHWFEFNLSGNFAMIWVRSQMFTYMLRVIVK